MPCHRPYEPLAVPKQIAPDLWIVDGGEIRMRYAGLSAPFPTRATVVRLDDGGLWVHSPTALTPDLATALERLGDVRHLIAPNTLHGAWIGDWRSRWPAARTYGPPSPPTYRGFAPEAIDEILGPSPPAAWRDAFEQVVVPGAIVTEVAFLHRPSRTLILADLIENFESARVRIPWRWLIQLAGAADPDGKAPIDMQASFRRHRPALRAAVDRMISWAPERVLLAHGKPYLSNGTAELRRAFRWAGAA